jgi:DNA-binding NarL/FixJ family response regulator
LLTATVWGCIRGLEARGEATFSPLDRQLAAAALERARPGAQSVPFELAIRDGENQNPFDLIRALPALLRSSPEPAASRATLRHGELTRREVEILGLVGDGKSDPEIADALFISPKTASVHVANIKAKLGLETRLEVALHARELGLATDDR